MKKFVVFLLVGFIFVFQGCTMAASNLIDEVSALDKPEKFKPRPIDEIVKKYVSIGISRAEAKKILVSEGFKVIEEKMAKSMNDCKDCEGLALSAIYNHRPLLPLLPADYKIVIEVRFRNGNVAVLHGWYVRHAY